jgi:hypothetical protein
MEIKRTCHTCRYWWMNACSLAGRCHGYKRFEPLMLLPPLEFPACLSPFVVREGRDEPEECDYNPNREESLDDIMDGIMEEMKQVRRDLARLRRKRNKERKEAGLPPIKPKRRRRK